MIGANWGLAMEIGLCIGYLLGIFTRRNCAWIESEHTKEKAMQPHQERIVAEMKDLKEKLAKLETFIKGATFQTLPQAEKDRLNLQAMAMTIYSIILEQRIKSF